MQTLITGSHGLIGSELMRRYKENAVGWDKLCNVDLTGVNFTLMDVDMIIHTAANDFIRDSVANPNEALENIIATHNVYEYARRSGCKKMIVFSSSRVRHEEDNPYVLSKRTLEMYAKTYQECYGIRTVIIRPETVWGYSNKNERVMVKWIQNAMNGEDIVIKGTHSKELAPVYVTDFVDWFEHIVDNFDEALDVYNVSGKVRAASEIAREIRDALDSQSRVVFSQPEPFQPQTCYRGTQLSSNIAENVKYVASQLNKEAKRKASKT